MDNRTVVSDERELFILDTHKRFPLRCVGEKPQHQTHGEV